MIGALKKLFESDLFSLESSSKPQHLSQEQLNLACAALLVEVAIIDGHFDEAELAALESVLHHEFDVKHEDIDQMISEARQESTDSTSMYQFTRLVNDHCDFNDKFKLITCMWRVAYADRNLDKYEEYIIRKVADLIHVSHGDFIRAKTVARDTSP